MKLGTRYIVLSALLMAPGLAGCRSSESVDPEAGSMGTAAQGSGGTGVGTRSTQGQGVVQTGSSTQRMSTGAGGPVSAPGPGQSGR